MHYSLSGLYLLGGGGGGGGGELPPKQTRGAVHHTELRWWSIGYRTRLLSVLYIAYRLMHRCMNSGPRGSEMSLLECAHYNLKTRCISNQMRYISNNFEQDNCYNCSTS